MLLGSKLHTEVIITVNSRTIKSVIAHYHSMHYTTSTTGIVLQNSLHKPRRAMLVTSVPLQEQMPVRCNIREKLRQFIHYIIQIENPVCYNN